MEGLDPPQTLRDLKRGFFNVERASADQERRLPNKDFVIPLDGSLKCRPMGGNSPQFSINEAFVGSQIVEPGGGFLPSAHHALKAAIKAHGGWPGHMSLERPNSAKSARVSASGESQLASRSRSPSPTPSLQGSAAWEGGDDGDEGDSDLRGDGAPASSSGVGGGPAWPKENSRRVTTNVCGGRNPVRPSGWIQSGAEWYACYSCSCDDCPGRLIVMRMRDAKHELRVVFKHDCVHSPDSTPHQQLRGADRADLTTSAVARRPAHVHGLAAERRTVEQHLNNDISTCGSSAAVVRTATWEQRKAESRLDPDPMVSLLKGAAAAQAADLQSTPEADRKDRLWTGGVPYFVQLPGHHFSLLMMTDHQLRFWMYCCQKRLTGLYVDATEGLVRTSVSPTIIFRLCLWTIALPLLICLPLPTLPASGCLII